MKNILALLFFGVTLLLNAQQIDYNTKKGKDAYTVTHDNVKYKFVSQCNLDIFKNNPEKFIPQYGGYCAYAIGTNGNKVGIDPETFEIRDNKLYLFYNSWGINTLTKWMKEDAEKLKNKADATWQKIKTKK